MPPKKTGQKRKASDGKVENKTKQKKKKNEEPEKDEDEDEDVGEDEDEDEKRDKLEGGDDSKDDDIESLTVSQLKDRLRAKGRSVKGSRSDLLKRLKDILNTEKEKLEQEIAKEDKALEAELDEKLFEKNASSLEITSGSIKVGSWKDVTETKQLPKPTGGTIRIDPLPAKGFQVINGKYLVYYHPYLQLVFHESCTLKWLEQVVTGIVAGQYFGGNHIPGMENIEEIGRYDWLHYFDGDLSHVVYCIDESLAREPNRVPKIPYNDEDEFDYPPRFFNQGVVFGATQEYRYGLVLDHKCFVCTGYEVEEEGLASYMKGIQQLLKS